MTSIELPKEKKVRHLTLHRHSRTIDSREFNKLTFQEQLEVLQTVSGRCKYDLLIESAEAEELLQRLPAQEVFLLARELGAEDVPELVAMASSEQVTAIIDLDCWNGDHLDREAGLRWLALLLDAEDEKILKTLSGMDNELLGGILQQWVAVRSGPEDLEDDDARAEAMNKNGGYGIEYVEGEAAKPIQKLLNVLLRHDYDQFRRLIETIRQELPIQLEEDLYRWRSGRLQDFGFSDPLEAKSIYSWLDPLSFRAEDYRRAGSLHSPRGIQAPGYLLVEISTRPLLAEVLANGLDQDAAWELTFLLNKLMMADKVDPGDSTQVSAALERLYATLNLALESLAGQDVEQAIALFDSVYFEYLFRLGFSLTLQLKKRAQTLKDSVLGPYLDQPMRSAVDCLCLVRPEFYLPLEEINRDGRRSFNSVADLELASNLLQRLELQQMLVTEHFPALLPDPQHFELTGCEPEELEEVAVSDLFLTALANQLFERPFTPEPFPQSELTQLHDLVTVEGALNPQLLEQTEDWLESLLPGAGRFAQWCLAVWDEEFCSFAPEELNPRYLAGLIVRLD